MGECCDAFHSFENNRVERCTPMEHMHLPIELVICLNINNYLITSGIRTRHPALSRHE